MSPSRRRRVLPSNNQFHPVVDDQWLLAQEESNHVDRQVLQTRLTTAQSHLHKDAIRQAHVVLAEHDIQTGNLSSAMSGLRRAVEYCTNRNQTFQISLRILEVAFGLEDYFAVR